jgi:hypothetical protein
MKMHRDDVVGRLRDMGRDEEADLAEKELPEKFNPEKFEGRLHSYGLGPDALDPPGGPLGWGAAGSPPLGGGG